MIEQSWFHLVRPPELCFVAVFLYFLSVALARLVCACRLCSLFGVVYVSEHSTVLRLAWSLFRYLVFIRPARSMYEYTYVPWHFQA